MDAAASMKEIEDGLKECGNRLISLPPSSEELITLLDKVESLLIKVGQDPADSTKDALLPVMEAVVRSELLKHTDADVKVMVASCISEITRISAPLQPYDDKRMKEIFQLTVRALEELSHSGRRYHKAVNVLQTVAEVKACMLLLDLDCNTLVVEMFQMFLSIIRPDHPVVVFTSMEAIMTLVIEESDEINMELLQPLLDSLRKKNQIWSPISSKLGEKVLKECASTARPCLQDALKSRSMNLEDYADIVATICNETHGREKMTQTENVTDAVYPKKVGTSAAVMCEKLLEDGTPSNNNANSSKALQHCSQMEQLKNTGVSTSSHGRRDRANKKASMENKDDAHLGLSVPEGDVLQPEDKRKVTSCSKRIPSQSSRKRGSVRKGDVDTSPALNIVKGEGKLTDADESSEQHVDEKKQNKQIQDIEESGDKEIKLSFEDENCSIQLAKTKRRRKLTMRKDQDSKRRRVTKYYGEEIVGNRIRVWWPMDEMFYEGAVTAFDPVEKKHQISYDDGEMENLNLKEEVFEFLEDNPSDKKHEADLKCNAVSSVPSTKKKAKRSSSIKKEPRVSSSKRCKRNPQKCNIGSMDIPISDKMNNAADVGCETSSGIKELVEQEDNNITQKHEPNLQSNDASSAPSIKKKAKRTPSMKTEPGVSSSKRSKRKPQKSDIESLDIAIPDKMNNAADVGCETSSGIKELVEQEDNNITQKHEPNLQSNDASSAPSIKKKAKRTRSTKKEPGVSSSKRSKRKLQKSDAESLDIPVPDKMNNAADVGCEIRSGIKVVEQEDNNITQKHEPDLQSNDASSAPSIKKKAKRTRSTKKEPGVSSSKRSKRKPQKSDAESLDIPVPDKMNNAADVGCEISSGIKVVEQEDNNITQMHEPDLQSNDALSAPSLKKKAKRTRSTNKEPGVSSSKRSKRKPQKSDVESMDIPIPYRRNTAADIGCETSSGIKEVVDKEDYSIAQKYEPDLQGNDASSAPSTKKKAKRTSLINKELGVSSSKRSKRNVLKSGIESLDIPIPNKMNDASDVGCEASSGKKLVVNEDDMVTKAEGS